MAWCSHTFNKLNSKYSLTVLNCFFCLLSSHLSDLVVNRDPIMAGIVCTQNISTSPSPFLLPIYTALTGSTGNLYLHHYPINGGEILIVKRFLLDWSVQYWIGLVFKLYFYIILMRWNGLMCHNVNSSDCLTSLNLITFLPSHYLALSLIVVYVLLQVPGENKCFWKPHQCHVSRAKKK